MPLYFLLIDAHLFDSQLRPALAESWQRRTFLPCRVLSAVLRPAAAEFRRRYGLGSGELLLSSALGTLPFDRQLWRALAGDLLLVASAELPEIDTALETLVHLLGEKHPDDPRSSRSPIEQAHLGSHDLTFGTAFYRPESAGFNDRFDVIRLSEYLASIDPDRWNPDQLAGMPGMEDESDRLEELEYARQCFRSLREMYRRAAHAGQVIVCERL